jgi:aspartate/methionine/tyrosine aminotransferase
MTQSDIELPRGRMHSPYMEWAKTQQAARFNLAASGMSAFPLSDLAALAGLRVEDLELTGPAGYGYAPLQQALAAKAGVSPDCVVAAAGTSMANHLAMASSFEPGDEILVEQPTYELLLSTARFLGANIKRFARRVEEDFRLDPREVVLTNLHNPSSAFADEATLREVGELAKGAGARVLVDEVYLESLYSTPWRSAFHLGKHFITTSSLTKAYGLAGLRCGWALAEPELARAMWRLNDFYGVNAAHPAERLSVIALRHLSEIAARPRDLLAANRPLLHAFLNSRPELQVAKQPNGTVLFPRLGKGKIETFCRVLRQKYETSVVPGGFFESPEHFRIFAGAQTAALKEGLQRVASALDELV